MKEQHKFHQQLTPLSRWCFACSILFWRDLKIWKLWIILMRVSFDDFLAFSHALAERMTEFLSCDDDQVLVISIIKMQYSSCDPFSYCIHPLFSLCVLPFCIGCPTLQGLSTTGCSWISQIHAGPSTHWTSGNTPLSSSKLQT